MGAFEMSEQTNELFAALAKFQDSITSVKKSKQGHGYMFAPLDAILDMARPRLAKQDLYIGQFMDDLSLTTIIGHTSGQWIRSSFLMQDVIERFSNHEANRKGGMNPAQALGATIMYCRRYTIQPALGIATDEDTDAASTGQEAPRKAKATTKKPKPKPQPKRQEAPKPKGYYRGVILEAAMRAGYTEKEVSEVAKELFGVTDLNLLYASQTDTLLERMDFAAGNSHPESY